MKNLDLLVTLWPTMPHFERFARDGRLAGIRLNSAMATDTMEQELGEAQKLGGSVPLYFDVKGRQLRIAEVLPKKDHLEVILNHAISVRTPTMVLFKAGEDRALLREVDGNRLVFDGGPVFNVKAGESLHIRHPSLDVKGPMFPDYELKRIAAAKHAGFDKWVLSYVEKATDIDELRNLVGSGEIIAKIESLNGLEYVAHQYRKRDGLVLMAARGDLYVEVNRPHEILAATKLIIDKDPEAIVGSRILLTLIDDSPHRRPLRDMGINKGVPECSDLSELAWLYDIGYRKMMLCDGLCLNEQYLSRAVNVFESFRREYPKYMS